MLEILGLIMAYSWVHSIIILLGSKPKKLRSTYEKGVLIVGLTFIILFVLGSIM